MLEGYKAVNVPRAEDKKSQSSLYARLEAIADMNHPSLRVAYIDEFEERLGDKLIDITNKLSLSYGSLFKLGIQKLLEDLKELTEYKEYPENSSNETDASNSNQEKEKPPQDSDIRQLIREECSIEVCEEQKKNTENTILELVEICRQKELLCIHDNVDDLIESALNSKLLSINSKRLDKKEQEVKNVVEQPTERGTHEIIKSGVEELVPILSENEVTSEDKKECDMPVCENSPISDDHSEIFSNSNNDDDISSDDGDFKDIEYVEALLFDPEIVSLE
nr:hypothetical protein [Tanacetum cinerariifolium]